jgi:hypothetical protein
LAGQLVQVRIGGSTVKLVFGSARALRRDVGGDRGVLLGVAAVVGAVDGPDPDARALRHRPGRLAELEPYEHYLALRDLGPHAFGTLPVTVETGT